MQTFLAYPDFAKSARILDRSRLGKQRVENLQIMKALVIPGYGWQNHPAVDMWRGYEGALMAYQKAVCEEWLERGYRDTCLLKTWDIYDDWSEPSSANPHWLGSQLLHRSHQSNLVRKDPVFYRPLFPDVPDNLDYFWPIGDF